MTLDQLLVLEAIVTTGTFRGAAEKLNKAQSAISHQIKKLEDEIQFDLFSRAEYRPELTSKGVVFFREAARVLENIRTLEATAHGLRSELEPIVRIAMTATMAFDPILKILGDIGAKYPSTHIRVDTEMMGGPLSRLLNNEAELIFCSLHDVPVDQVETLPIGWVTIKPVAHKTFPVAKSKGILSRQQMQGYVQVVVSGTGKQNFEQSRDLLSGGQRWNVSDFVTKKSVIMSGLGWGGMPEHMIKEELANGDLVPLRVEGFSPRVTEIFAIRRRDKPMGKVTLNIWTAIQEHFNC